MKNILFPVLVGITVSTAYGKDVPERFIPQVTNQQFRNEIISYIEQQVKNSSEIKKEYFGTLDEKLNNAYQASDWTLNIACYQKGEVVGQGAFNNKNLNLALYNALKKMKLTVNSPENCQFQVDFAYYPDRHYRFISYDGQGLELTGNRVAVRKLTTESIKKQISDSIGYISRVMNLETHGFYKFYDARQDKAETLLRTIYSASSLFTFIKTQAAFPDLELRSNFKPIAQFILSQQLLSGPNRGAFYYSYDPVKKKPQKRLVVGTASKTIFTLLLLNELYPDDPVYLTSAKLAGNWLLEQVHEDGRIVPVQVYENGRWIKKEKQSLLYSGQVLSALSRLYIVTKDQRYLDKAKVIANLFINKINQHGPVLGDDYRPANSISSSWVLMSLIDIAKATPSTEYLQAIQQIAAAIRTHQLTNFNDIYYVGKFADAMTTSGNGWLNEVFAEYYPFCVKMKLGSCEQYKETMILSSRWLMQNAYRKNNTYNIKNPERAIGGFALNYHNHVVRTDAVCHGTNSLLYLLKITGNAPQVLIDIKEQPLFEILPMIRAGNKIV